MPKSTNLCTNSEPSLNLMGPGEEADDWRRGRGRNVLEKTNWPSRERGGFKVPKTRPFHALGHFQFPSAIFFFGGVADIFGPSIFLHSPCDKQYVKPKMIMRKQVSEVIQRSYTLAIPTTAALPYKQ